MSHHKTLWIGEWFVDINPCAACMFGRENNNNKALNHNNNHTNRRHKRSSRVKRTGSNLQSQLTCCVTWGQLLPKPQPRK